MGYSFTQYKEDGKYNAILTVSATEALNNTNMYCEFQEGGNSDITNHSLTATLLV